MMTIKAQHYGVHVMFEVIHLGLEPSRVLSLCLTREV
jgi:hypothetical protein